MVKDFYYAAFRMFVHRLLLFNLGDYDCNIVSYTTLLLFYHILSEDNL